MLNVDFDKLGPLSPEEIDEAGKDLVCVVPEGFEMTNDRWARIFKAWQERGRVMLSADEVAKMFKSDPSPQSN